MNDKISQLLTDRISQLLIGNDLNGIEYGEILGLKKSPMTDWKNKKSKPTLDQIITTSKYFDVSIDWLINGEGEMYKQTIDIQPKTYSNEELNIEEEILLETYKNSDRQTKKEILTFVASKTFNFKSPKSKLSIYENGETSTTKEKMLATQKIAC